MTAELITLGISHKTASVDLRERLALTQSAVTGFLRAGAGPRTWTARGTVSNRGRDRPTVAR